MEENNQTGPAGPMPASTPSSLPESAKKPFYKQTWFIAVAAVALLALIGPLIALVSSLFGGGSSAEATFLKMFETASQKNKVRYAYELTRPKTADFPAVFVQSLAEYDATNKDYRVAFVSDSIFPRAERCIDGKEYEPVEDPDTLDEAKAAMQGEMKERKSTSYLGTCKYQTPRFHGSFTDGILPVGLDAERAKKTVQGLKGRGGVSFTDEGSATYKGKTGRKISFEISEQKTGTKHRANIFFYAFRDGPSNKVGANVPSLDTMRDNFETRLHDTTPQPELKGFYIIDEKTNLPIYSEIVTVAGGLSDFTPTTIWSEYAFPDSLSMDLKTPLVTIGKPDN